MTIADSGAGAVSGADFDDQDLVGISNAQKRNWRGIFIALMVIVAVLAMIIMSVVLLTPEDDFGLGGRWRRMRGRRIRLGDILEDGQSHSVQLFNGSWISGHEMIYKTTEGGVGLLDARTMTSTPLMSNHTFNLLNPVVAFTMSPDRKYLLLAHDAQKLFRHSYLARYTVYTISNSQMISVTVNTTETGQNYTAGQQSVVSQPYFMHVQWNGGVRASGDANSAVDDDKAEEEDSSADGYEKPVEPVTTPLGLVAVNSNYDIYYVAVLPEKTADAGNLGRRPRGWYRGITTSGVPGIISNGVPDWLYEEEILKSRKAMWTSSPSNPKIMLLYATFDDTDVGEYKFPMYLNTGFADRHPYPVIRSLRYPKAGTPNPRVTLSVVNIADIAENLKNNNVRQPIKIRELTPPSMFQFTDDYYFTAVQWVSPEEVCVVWLNRRQNTSVTTICKSPMWICQETQIVNAAPMMTRHGYAGHGGHPHAGNGQGTQAHLGGWVDVTGAPVFSRDGDGYVSLTPIRHGANAGSGPSGLAGMPASNARSDPGAGYYRQIVAVNITKKLLVPLTYGPWTVDKILSWDYVTNTIYFLAVPADRPSERHLYATTHYYNHVTQLSSSSSSYRSHQPHTPAHLIDPQPSVCLSCSVEDSSESANQTDEKSTDVNDTATRPPTTTELPESPESSLLYKSLSSQYQSDQAEPGQGHSSGGTGSKNAKQDKYDDQADQRKRQHQRLRENEQQQQKSNRDPRNRQGGNQNRCSYYDAEFSPTAEYYALICLGPGVPMVTLHKTVVVPQEEDKKPDEDDQKKKDSVSEPRAPQSSRRHPKISSKFVGTLENNTYLFDKYNTKVHLPASRTFEVRVSAGHSARVRLYLPPGVRFDSDGDSGTIGSGGAGANPDDDRKYPLVVHIGDGPGTQSVIDTWQLEWSVQYLAAAHDYVVAVVDGGRGSGGRGYDLLLSIYKRLGNYDVADQLEVTEYLRDNLHFVDKRRVAVWGSAGYGGYITTKLLLNTMIQEKKRNHRNPSGGSRLPLFRCGIAIAPVCSWNLYASFYAERHMGMPDENPKEYHDSDLVTDIQQLMEAYKEEESLRSPPLFYGQRHSGSGRHGNSKETYYSPAPSSSPSSQQQQQQQQQDQSQQPPYRYPEFYFVHGTADSKVHVQHTMRLTAALTRAVDGVLQYKQQVYPDEDHDLAGVRPHLYTSMSYFLDQCFRSKEGEDDDGNGDDDGYGHHDHHFEHYHETYYGNGGLD
ncbi:LOW QUALITY PROTEIN: dipeptidyl aminopeptidase-like protein 6 [Adelges cooleyi]|uniref:LOW QUALITY PROTEIN: dipeptidyl aminopeptidase-like protein 6 n=1 Tax=Adelges cooleyi TaxID=133065 RepID=UPI00217F76DE|nr:LOW QUALITY PROTEIN: dipeptidyl aminopeptidase-like protein 6 [Adelges cooleyi]